MQNNDNKLDWFYGYHLIIDESVVFVIPDFFENIKQPVEQTLADKFK